jgi:putative ABC transport system permease protein
MGFVLRMAGREFRASWRRLLFFFVCVAIGVGAIVALRSVIQNVRDALVREARTLTASDVLVSTNRPWDDETRAALERRLRSAPVVARTEAIETASMARPADAVKGRVRMVELQGVQAGFPLYGQVQLQGGRPYSYELIAGRGALVRPELLTQLDVRVGDTLRIGDVDFTIRGVVLTEPGRRLGAFSLGPRVLVSYEDLQKSGLLRFGSRARYRVMLKVGESGIDALVRDLRADFKQRFVTVSSYRTAEDQIGDDLRRAENYLSLVGFVMAVLGGIGVWSVTRVFVRQKMHAIAVLKCLGASSRQVIAVNLVQVTLLALAGVALGVTLAGAALAAIPESLFSDFPGGVRPHLSLSAVAQGAGVGLLVSLLFALVPLLDVRGVKPLLLLRDEAAFAPAQAAPRGRRSWAPGRLRQVVSTLDRTKVTAVGLVLLSMILLASWQAGSLTVGLTVTLGFLAVALALHAAGTALVWIVRPLRAAPWFAVRHAVISVGRPGNQTRVILLAVGLGAFFIIGVRALQTNLLREFSLDVRSGGGDLFLVDIQPDQRDAVAGFLGQAAPGVRPRLVPVLRARVTGVRGRTLNLDGVEDVRGRGSLAREYVITYRAALEANETLVGGAFWPPAPSAAPEVSIEEGIHQRFGIALGDMVRFDVLGRSVEAQVTSVRRVEWSDTRAGGFMFVFRPGTLERAPQTYLGILKGPTDPAARAALQRDLVAKFSNVSVIDVFEVAQTVERVLGNVTVGITVVGAVALLSGLLIVIGSVAMTKFERLHDAAVFKTLGASSGTMAAMLCVEYGALGLLAGLVGALGSTLLSWAVARFVLDIRWWPAPGVTAAGVALTAVVVAVVGVVASADVLRRKPLSILRAE